LIYLNNAIVNLNPNRPPRRIAVSVPIGSNVNVASEMLRGIAQAQNEINNKDGAN
jgi:branched-chain amino acid transport system substrate-binding protein